MPTLVDIAFEHRQLLDKLRDGDDDDALLELAGVSMALAAENTGAALGAKVSSYVHVVRELRADVLVIEREIERLQARKQARENRADVLDARLLAVLDAAGFEKVVGPTITVSLQLNPAAVEILDESKVPDEHRHPLPPPPKEPPRGKPNKVSIRQAFERTGEIVPGTKVSRSKRLVVR